MKASTICAGLLSACALFGAASATSADVHPAQPKCRMSLDLAELAAIGATHRYAEYVLHIDPGPKTKGTFTLDLTAGTDNGQTTPIVVNGFSAGPLRNNQGEPVVVVVLPSAGIRWFAIDGDASAAGAETCTDVGFTMSTLTYSTSASFDDSAPWVALDKPVVVPISDAGFINRVAPDYPEMAKEEDIQGDVSVKIVIGPEGNVEAAWVDESSGSDMLDGASIAAAKFSTFKPPHLPAAYGGQAIASIYIIVYTYSID